MFTFNLFTFVKTKYKTMPKREIKTTKVYAYRFPMLPTKRWNEFKKAMDIYADKLKAELIKTK